MLREKSLMSTTHFCIKFYHLAGMTTSAIGHDD